MKIAYIINARLPTEKAHGYQIVKMCEAFAIQGADVLLCHPFRFQNKDLQNMNVFDFYKVKKNFKVITTANLDLLPLSDNKILFILQTLLWGAFAVFKLRKEEIDIYYTRDALTVFWMSIFGFPIVYEEHVIHSGAGQFLLRMVSQKSSLKLVVVLTNFIKDNFIKLGFSPNKVIVASDGVDLAMFKNLPDKINCRKKLELPEFVFIVGYVGRFKVFGNQEKGIPQLIEAISILKNKNILLLLVGGPQNAVNDYLNLAKKLNVRNIKIVNQVPVSEVPYWMRACDAVTIPWTWTKFSAYYTSPLKLFEYMASKTPIIASDLPSLREILNEKNSILVKPGDSMDLADGIEKVLNNKNLANQISEQAYRDVQNYTWENRARKILSFLCI